MCTAKPGPRRNLSFRICIDMVSSVPTQWTNPKYKISHVLLTVKRINYSIIPKCHKACDWTVCHTRCIYIQANHSKLDSGDSFMRIQRVENLTRESSVSWTEWTLPNMQSPVFWVMVTNWDLQWSPEDINRAFNARGHIFWPIECLSHRRAQVQSPSTPQARWGSTGL